MLVQIIGNYKIVDGKAVLLSEKTKEVTPEEMAEKLSGLVGGKENVDM